MLKRGWRPRRMLRCALLVVALVPGLAGCFGDPLPRPDHLEGQWEYYIVHCPAGSTNKGPLHSEGLDLNLSLDEPCGTVLAAIQVTVDTATTCWFNWTTWDIYFGMGVKHNDKTIEAAEFTRNDYESPRMYANMRLDLQPGPNVVDVRVGGRGLVHNVTVDFRPV